MEQFEIELIKKYSQTDAELNQLWQEHQQYENQLEKLENKRLLTPQEQTEIKNLKKKKLAGKTKIQSILESYKGSEVKNEA